MTKSAHVYDWCDAPLPLPPGKNPYRIKGEFYRHLDVTITKVDGKSGGALMKAFARDGLDAFQRQPFTSSGFFDNLPLPRMVMCISEVMGRDVGELTTKMGKNAAEAQLKSIYKGLLAEITLDTFPQAFGKLLAHYYDYGTLQVTPTTNGFRLVRGGIPLPVAEWWCLVSIPFVSVVLRRDLKTSWRVEPEKDGVGTATWDVRL